MHDRQFEDYSSTVSDIMEQDLLPIKMTRTDTGEVVYAYLVTDKREFLGVKREKE